MRPPDQWKRDQDEVLRILRLSLKHENANLLVTRGAADCWAVTAAILPPDTPFMHALEKLVIIAAYREWGDEVHVGFNYTTRTVTIEHFDGRKAELTQWQDVPEKETP